MGVAGLQEVSEIKKPHRRTLRQDRSTILEKPPGETIANTLDSARRRPGEMWREERGARTNSMFEHPTS